MFNNFGASAMIEDMMGLIQNLSDEVIGARVRIRALLEIMEEKGLLAPGEFDARAAAIWERDYDALAAELRSQGEPEMSFVDDEVEAD